MPIDREGGDVDNVADSTQIKPLPAGRTPSLRESGRFSESYLSPGKSIRNRGRTTKGGLALRIAIPVVVATVICGLVSLLVLRDRSYSLQIETLKGEAADIAFGTALYGRHIVEQRQEFHTRNPNYFVRGEWPAGEHWMVAKGFVGHERWMEETGFDLNEMAPVTILDKAAERVALADLGMWLNTETTDLAAIYLINSDGTLLGSSLGGAFRLEQGSLKNTPLTGSYTHTRNYRVIADYLPDFQPEPLVRGVCRIMSAREPDRLLGSTVAVIRTHRLSEARQAFLNRALLLLTGQLLVIGLVCWCTVRGRAAGPLRKLAEDMQVMAEGDYTRRSAVAGTDEIGTLAQAYNSMAERLRVAIAVAEETSRLERELDVAKGIQNNLLPPQTPHVRGFDIHTAYRPAREIGGDYYDFLLVDSRHLGIAIADASGKSIPAALVMSTTRAILRFVAPGSGSAAETLGKINAILSADIPKGMFVTAYYLILDPLERSMLCSSAGHTPLLLAREDGSVEMLNPGGIALGFDNGPIFQRSIREQRIQLEKGDRVLLYTDGVVECVNAANEEYSDRRLREFLRRNRDLSSFDFIGALLADLDRHRGAAEIRDDTTIVTFKVL